MCLASLPPGPKNQKVMDLYMEDYNAKKDDKGVALHKVYTSGTSIKGRNNVSPLQ